MKIITRIVASFHFFSYIRICEKKIFIKQIRIFFCPPSAVAKHSQSDITRSSFREAFFKVFFLLLREKYAFYASRVVESIKTSTHANIKTEWYIVYENQIPLALSYSPPKKSQILEHPKRDISTPGTRV